LAVVRGSKGEAAGRYGRPPAEMLLGDGVVEPGDIALSTRRLAAKFTVRWRSARSEAS
jgi:hypothetical protein